MKTIRQAPGILSEGDQAAELAAQIRARIAMIQSDPQDRLDALPPEAILTLFCREDDIAAAQEWFDEQPVQATLAKVFACLLIAAAQKSCAILQEAESSRAYWKGKSLHVAVFETTGFLWSQLAAVVRDMVRHEFEDERNAVTAAVLAGFNKAGVLIKAQWDGFQPESYALSRTFCYPPEKEMGAARFAHVIVCSKTLRWPMTPEKLRAECIDADSSAHETAAAYLAEWVWQIQENVVPEMIEAAAESISFYLEHRLD